MKRRDQVLYQDTDDKMIAGVCSGLARYFDVDTTLMLVAFVVAAMLGGGGILGYLILWIVLDPAPAGYWDERTEDSTTASISSDQKAGDEAGAVDLTDGHSSKAPRI